MHRLAYTTSLLALMAAAPAVAQTSSTPADASPAGAANQSAAPIETTQTSAGAPSTNDVIVTATRRNEKLQDVPLSVTAFSQAELTAKGIVGYEGIARETPGVVLASRGDDNVSVTTRGISTNGYQAGLQASTIVYLDELPLTTIGNSVTLNPDLYDVERVEFLRGPQGTLFGSGSLSGAMRILTHSPELSSYDMSALADIGVTPDGGGIRQRYNAMLNIPLVDDKLALRVVGFYRHEDGYIDNIGLGVKNSNTLKDFGGRAILLWKPTDRLSVRLMGVYENSHPDDASLITPSLGDLKRYTTIPDLYTSKTQLYNATVNYDLGFANLTSSTSYAYQDSLFDVDLGGTFALAIPFYLFDHGITKTFVEETRLVSKPGSRLEWTLGAYYLHRNGFLDGRETSTPEFLAAHDMTGLPADATFSKFGDDQREYELAGFGELTYHLTDKLSATGGVRYGRYGTTVDTAAGYNYAAYFANALGGVPGPLTATPNGFSTQKFPSAGKASWKASISYKPSSNLTTYVTVSTGYRTPVYNARAGVVSSINPNDIVIPTGAGSDTLTNYEVGLKGNWLGGKITADLAAYYIDWRNIQVQANRQSDSIQFATNIAGAVSKGLEAEIAVKPVHGLTLGLNGSLNDAKITDITAEQAAISGAVKGARLASPHVQGSLYGTYNYDLMSGAKGFTSFQVEYVSSFPDGFPNTPGTGAPSPLFDYTDNYTNIDLQTGVRIGKLSWTFYVENVTNSRAVTYVHPEAFVYSRYAVLRPRTFGVRIGYNM
jgi:outer membrane receptor protein involved in Fe transport